MQNPSRKIETVSSQQPEAAATTFQSSIIPKSFMLGGLKIDVQLDDTLVNTRKVIGEARYAEQSVRIDPSAAPRQMVEQAFIHELTHWIFYLMNEDELRNNEKIVDLFAHFMYQALVTAEPMTVVADTQPAVQEA